MKRTFIAILAAMFAATGANAYSLVIDVVTSTGGAVDVGDTITLNATIDGMDTNLGPLGGVDVFVGWDNTAFEVANNDVINPPFGAGTQTLFPGFSGVAGDTICQNTGNSCSFINQAAPFFGSQVATGTITGSIVMEVLDISGGSFNLEFGVVSDLYIIGATFGTAVDPGDVTINGGAITVVPEPTTAAMLGLGLLGLGFTGRRR